LYRLKTELCRTEALDDFETEIRSSIATNPRPAPTNLPEALQNVRLADGSSPKPSEIPSTEQKFADSMKNILSSDEFAKKVLEDVDDPNMSSLLEEFSKTLQAAASEKKEGSDAPSNPEEEDEIQKNISKTLEHLSENVKKLEDAKDSDEMLDKLLDEFAADGEMGGMMESMMKQLMSKDILYEPLKEMAEKVRCISSSCPSYDRYNDDSRWVTTPLHRTVSLLTSIPSGSPQTRPRSQWKTMSDTRSNTVFCNRS
jgi:hypothetical protein